MTHTDLSGKRVLVTLPVDAKSRREFEQVVTDAGGHVSFVSPELLQESDVEDAAIIIGNVSASMLHASQSLTWFQTSSAGYDNYLAPGILAPETLLTCATGAYGQAVSEHMIASLLCLMKKLHLYRDNQLESSWADEGPVTTLVDATVLVMGTGDIGTAFARLVTAMGAHAWGVRRNVAACHEPFERMVALSDVHSVLGEVDVVACVLPSTPETRLLANATFFDAMKRGSYLVNAGRGDLIDTSALVEALRSGQLAGAALDVTNPEPLPADNPLWDEPNALITPHVAGFWHLQATVDNVVNICLTNLRAYLAGEPLRNVVKR